MKILHIVAGDLSGGAARGAYWLHLGLKELDINSKVLTSSNITLGDENVIRIIKTKKDKFLNISRVLAELLLINIFKNKRVFSTGLFGIDFTKTEEYKSADIIHLHWINGGLVNMKHLSKIDKPIIWTMRDMWPFTGGCHYSMECEKYKTDCVGCYQLKRHNYFDLSSFILNRKRKYLPKNIKIVGISNWLSYEAKKSKLFKEFEVITISNNIDTKEFFPINKELAKKILGIKTNKKIVLCGSTDLKDFYKGFNKYLEAIKLLNNDRYFLCFFGNIDKKIISDLGFEYKSLGYLNDNISLRLAYSCSNVFVAPSLMDAFGKTIAESMACGTPVVCFDATGPKDIVTHKIDGYKAKPFCSIDLSKGIDWILNTSEYEKLCSNGIDKVKNEFNSIIIAEKYIELYKKCLINN